MLNNKLPRYCYTRHPTERHQVVVVHRGERGYISMIMCTNEAEAIRTVNSLNKSRGVTPAQREAMTAGSMFGWHVPAANTDNYDAEGKLK